MKTVKYIASDYRRKDGSSQISDMINEFLKKNPTALKIKTMEGVNTLVFKNETKEMQDKELNVFSAYDSSTANRKFTRKYIVERFVV